MLKEVLIRILAAVVLGGLIGYERERRHRPAGFRTIMLVCLGSTLVTFLASGLLDGQNGAAIIAAIVTGIGFLGAGSIISGNNNGNGKNNNVMGITTAATIWLIACVGIGIGLGYYIESAIVVLVSYLILEFGGYLEVRSKLK